MAIKIDYRVCDEDITDGLADVAISKEYSAEEDSDLVTLTQDGSEIALTPSMVKDLIETLQILQKGS